MGFAKPCASKIFWKRRHCLFPIALPRRENPFGKAGTRGGRRASWPPVCRQSRGMRSDARHRRPGAPSLRGGFRLTAFGDCLGSFAPPAVRAWNPGIAAGQCRIRRISRWGMIPGSSGIRLPASNRWRIARILALSSGVRVRSAPAVPLQISPAAGNTHPASDPNESISRVYRVRRAGFPAR